MAEKKKVTANEVYDLLLNEFKIKEQIGSVERVHNKFPNLKKMLSLQEKEQ